MEYLNTNPVMTKLFSFPESVVQKQALNEHLSSTSGAPDPNKQPYYVIYYTKHNIYDIVFPRKIAKSFFDKEEFDVSVKHWDFFIFETFRNVW